MPTTSIRNFVRSIALLGMFLAGAAGGSAQTKINAATQINYPPITGSGAPTALCTNLNYGQPYQNTAAVPNTYYTCGSDGWQIRSGSVIPITFLGAWSSLTTYTVNQAVYYASTNSTYVSLQNGNLNQNPSTATTYWTLLVSGSAGINQLTGDVAAGPGAGSQTATLATVNSSPGTCGDATHVCQVTTNGKGQTIAQTQVAISSGGSSVTLPGSPTAVWAGGSGSSVPDTSGNGNNITITSGATASSAGITFTAASQAVQTPVTGTYQTAMVCYTHDTWPLYITNPTTDISSIAETVPTLIGTTTQTGSTWLAGMNGTQNTNNAGVANGYIQPSVVNPSGGYLATQYTPVNGGPHCTIHVRDSTNDLFYLDGVLQANSFSGTSSGLSMVGNTVLGGTIVSGTPSSSAWFGGTLHLVALWPTRLTAAEANQAEQYATASLLSRNLAAPGAAPPTLSDGVSRLTVVGNSITACAGNGPSTCWNTLLTLTNTSLNTNINRVALGGTAQTFMNSSAAYREDPINAPNASTNVVLLWDGTNDGCRIGDTPDQQWALDVAYALHKRSMGYKVLIGTMIDYGATPSAPSGKCGGGLTPEAYQAAYNNLIYTQSARWFDGIVDFSGDLIYGGAAHLGCSGCALNTTYFLSDHVHPIGPSAAIMANIASAEINLVTSNAATPVVSQTCATNQFVSGITSTGQVICGTPPTPGNCGVGFAHYASLTIPSGQVVGGSNLSNYPALIGFNGATQNSITLTNLKTVANGGQVQSSTGLDITFCSASSGGSILPYELVAGTYAPTTGAGEWYVKLPSVNYGASTAIYMFWDDSSAIDQSQPSVTWSDYAAVYHFGVSGTLGTNDSSGNSNNLTATNSPSSISGPFGGAVSTSGATQTLTSSAPANMPWGGVARTVEMWASIPTSEQYAGQFGYGLIGGTGRFVLQSQPAYSGGPNIFTANDGGVSPAAWSYTFDNNWHFYAVTTPASAEPATLTAYIDGAAATPSGSPGTYALNTDSTGGIQINGYPLSAGAGVNGGQFTIDEARISRLQRTAGWFGTQYNNQSNPASFWTVGTIH